MPRPTSTHEQREAVRLLALQCGVREAARKLGLSQSRVQSWSQRFNWFPSRQPDLNLAPLGISDVATIATKAADSLASELQEHGRKTKYNISRAALKASDTFSEMEGAKVIDKADRLVAVTKVASTIHGWDTTTTQGALNLNVLSGGRAIVQVKTNENSE